MDRVIELVAGSLGDVLAGDLVELVDIIRLVVQDMG